MPLGREDGFPDIPTLPNRGGPDITEEFPLT